jgi:hypothetical protein
MNHKFRKLSFLRDPGRILESFQKGAGRKVEGGVDEVGIDFAQGLQNEAAVRNPWIRQAEFLILVDHIIEKQEIQIQGPRTPTYRSFSLEKGFPLLKQPEKVLEIQ